MICIATYDIYHKNARIQLFYISTNNFENESSCVVLDKILNLKNFIQNFLPQTKVNIYFFFIQYMKQVKNYKSHKNGLFKPGKMYINKLIKVDKYI